MTEKTANIMPRKLNLNYTALLLAIILAFGAMVYSNTFNSPLVFDDEIFIINDTAVHMTELSPDAIKTAAVDGRPRHRYLPNISFALNYYFGRLNPFGYHLVNLIIHLLSGIFLFFFIQNTLHVSIKSPKTLDITSTQCNHRDGVYPRPKREGIKPSPTTDTTITEVSDYKTNPDIIAFFAALLWIVQPVGTQAVTYICQRMASMVAMFYILSLLCYVKGRVAMAGGRKALPYGGCGALVENVEKYNDIDDSLNPCRGGVYPRPDHFNPTQLGDGFTHAQKTDNAHNKFLAPILYFSGCVISALCAFATKENAGTLPLVLILYEWFFFQDLKLNWSRGQLLWIAFFIIVFAGVVFWYMGENPLVRILNAYKRRDFTLIERVMTEWRIVVYYLGLFLWAPPGRLNLDHDYPLSLSPVHPETTMAALAAIVCLLTWAAYAAKKDRLIAFAIFWFFITQATESTIIGIELVFEHRTYIPFMMISLLFVVAIFRFFKNRSLTYGLLVATALLFSVWTYQRNQIWENPIPFWTDAMMKSPNKPRAYKNLAFVYQQNDKYSEAVSFYKKALEIDETKDPQDFATYANLGGALIKQNYFFDAVYYYSKAIEQKKAAADILEPLAFAMIKIGELDSAKYYYQLALDIDPENLSIKKNLSDLSEFLNQFTDPDTQIRQLLAKTPDNPSLWLTQGDLFEKQGQLLKAATAYETALTLTDDNEKILSRALLSRLAKTYFLLQRLCDAAGAYRRLIALTPDNAQLYYNTAAVYALQGNFLQAHDFLEKASEKGMNVKVKIKTDPNFEKMREEEGLK